MSDSHVKGKFDILLLRKSGKSWQNVGHEQHQDADLQPRDIDLTEFGIPANHYLVPGATYNVSVLLEDRFDIEVKGDHPKLRRGAKVVYRDHIGVERTGHITGRYKRRNGYGVHAWGTFTH